VTRYPAYPEYKETGIEWLGEIPSHWKAKRLRRVLTRSMKKNDDEIEREMLELSAYAGIRKKEYESDTLIRPKADCLNYMVVKPQQLVVNPMWVINSGIGISYVSGIVSPAYRVYDVTPDLVPNYLHYLVKSSIYLSQYKRFIRGLTTYDRSVREDDFLSIEALIPPLPEQRAIAAFLDERTARLDAAIAEYRRLADLLREQRAALISHTVTQGLDPDVPRKDSGVEWIGEIPAHWEVKQIKYIAESLQTGPFGSQLHSSDYVIDGIPIVNPAHMQNGHIEPDWEVTVDEATGKRLSHQKLQTGDIVFARRGELGRCALVTEKENGWLCGTGSLRMRPRLNLVSPLFLSRVLSTKGISEWLTIESVGTTMDNLNTTILARLSLPIPPLPEQRAIAAHLDRETARIDAALAEIDAAIGHLEAYRAALIAAAVTGKIDVR
jgi:type I restriction enzyme S subunit